MGTQLEIELAKLMRDECRSKKSWFRGYGKNVEKRRLRVGNVNSTVSTGWYYRWWYSMSFARNSNGSWGARRRRTSCLVKTHLR